MKRAQRTPWIVAGLAILAGAAPADVGYVSQECRQFLRVPAGTPSAEVRWSQRLSLAACRDQVALLPVSNGEALPALVTSLENHAAPSIAIYREVGDTAPARTRILATYGLGMTYLDIAVRARSAIRVSDQYGGPTYGNAAYYQELKRLHEALEPLLASDLRSAAAAFDEVGFIAEDHPIPAASNPVVRTAVRNARNAAQLLH